MLKRGNKFLAIGLAAVGVLGAGSIAFATWIVGIQQKETPLELSLKVDDAIDSSISVSATLSDSELFVTDTEKIDASENVIISTGEVASDALTFSLNEIKVTKEAGAKDKQVQSFEFYLSSEESEKLNITLGETNNKIETTAGTNTKYRNDGGKVSYLTFATKTITVDKFDTKLDSDNKTSIYTLKSDSNEKLAFDWGTYFKTNTESAVPTSPAVFYNDVYCTKADTGNNVYNGFINNDEEFNKSQHTNIINELDAMKTYFTDTVNKLTVTLKVNFAN